MSGLGDSAVHSCARQREVLGPVCVSRQPEFWISVLLTILGYLRGVLYAVYVICSVDPDDDDDYAYVA